MAALRFRARDAIGAKSTSSIAPAGYNETKSLVPRLAVATCASDDHGQEAQHHDQRDDSDDQRSALEQAWLRLSNMVGIESKTVEQQHRKRVDEKSNPEPDPAPRIFAQVAPVITHTSVR